MNLPYAHKTYVTTVERIHPCSIVTSALNVVWVFRKREILILLVSGRQQQYAMTFCNDEHIADGMDTS